MAAMGLSLDSAHQGGTGLLFSPLKKTVSPVTVRDCTHIVGTFFWLFVEVPTVRLKFTVVHFLS